MSTTIEAVAGDRQVTDLAREVLYRFLAAVLSEPGSPAWQRAMDPENQRWACEAADLLSADASAAPVALGFGELAPESLTLRLLCAELAAPAERLRAEFDRVFGLGAIRECPPYETEYHQSAEPFFRSQQMADIAGFYRAFGLEPSHARPGRPDHLALELEFMAFLLMKRREAVADRVENPEIGERVSICDDAQLGFLRDHLVWWVPSFATGLRRHAGQGAWARLGEVLAAFLPTERGRFDLKAPRLPVQASVVERREEEAGCAGCSLHP